MNRRGRAYPGWEGDVSPAGQSVPLRTAGALHALVLDGSRPALAAAYPPAEVDDDTLWDAVDAAITEHETASSRPSTARRRPMRSAGPPSCCPRSGGCWSRPGDRPIDLSELGASAGLNLMLDRFAIETPDGRAGPDGQPRARLRPEWRAPPPARPLRVVDRAGRGPSSHRRGRSADALRLMSYLWPDQPDRMAMTRGAIGMGPTRPDEGDAAPWLARLTSAVPGASTWSTRRSPGNISRRNAEACTRHSRPRARATSDTPLAHIAFEADGRRDGGGADRAGSGPMRRARDPCTRRFSRPLGRLARLAIALRHGLLAWFRVKFGAIRGILDAVRDGYVH
jgi:hypothetical protein